MDLKTNMFKQTLTEMGCFMNPAQMSRRCPFIVLALFKAIYEMFLRRLPVGRF